MLGVSKTISDFVETAYASHSPDDICQRAFIDCCPTDDTWKCLAQLTSMSWEELKTMNLLDESSVFIVQFMLRRVIITHQGWTNIRILLGIGNCCVPFGGLYRSEWDPAKPKQDERVLGYLIAFHNILRFLGIPCWVGNWDERKRFLLPGKACVDTTGNVEWRNF